MHFKPLAICLCALLLPGSAAAQTILHGMVADSATMLPLPNINIRSIKTSQITVSDIRGHFEINAYANDTLIFSSVGYYKKYVSVKSLSEAGIVFLSESQKILNTIEITEDVLPFGIPRLPPEKPWQNPTQNKRFSETPGFQGIQTFGPGYVLKGPISRFSKYERERKKLVKIRQQNYESRDYVTIVNSPEVKEKIMADFNLTEEDYYRILALFNEKNKDIIYQLQENELISILIMFYAENARKK
jgi:hypothetical protein